MFSQHDSFLQEHGDVATLVDEPVGLVEVKLVAESESGGNR